MYKLTLVVAAAALTLTCDAAFAADLGHSAGGFKDEPAPSAPAAPWTGFYIGVGAGAGMADMELNREYTADYKDIFWDYTSHDAYANSQDAAAKGVFGTVQIGADYRFPGTRFVVGAFGDYDFGKYSGTHTTGWSNQNSYDEHHSGSSAEKWSLQDQWSIGGRIGALATPDTMLYGLAAYSGAKQNLKLEGAENTFLDGTTSKSVTTGGWTLGGGIETRLTGNWFLKGEYRYTSFDEGTLSAVQNTTGNFDAEGWSNVQNETVKTSTDVQSVRAVLTYKFGAERYESFK